MFEKHYQIVRWKYILCYFWKDIKLIFWLHKAKYLLHINSLFLLLSQLFVKKTQKIITKGKITKNGLPIGRGATLFVYKLILGYS